VRNSIAAGRRLAARLVVVQLGVSLLAAVGFLAQGAQAGAAAIAGGALAALGTAVFALRLFGAPAPAARAALAGFVLATALKWLVIGGGLLVLLAWLRCPAAPTLTGFCAALAIHLVAWRFKV
jgi:F0F1-type ATP synthase assembly protein I